MCVRLVQVQVALYYCLLPRNSELHNNPPYIILESHNNLPYILELHNNSPCVLKLHDNSPHNSELHNNSPYILDLHNKMCLLGEERLLLPACFVLFPVLCLSALADAPWALMGTD